MAKAQGIMTEKPIIVESSDTIDAVVEIFSSNKLTCAPVLTSLGEYAGTLTDLTLARILVLHQLQGDKYKKLAQVLDLLEPTVFVKPLDPFPDVLKAMLRAPVHRVYVRAKNGEIVGVISPKDLLRVLVTDSYEAEVIKKAINDELIPSSEET